MKRCLNVVIVLLVAILVSSCASTSSKRNSFDIYQYVNKELKTDDIVRLRFYAAGNDSSVANSATLFLGYYYLISGDRAYAKFLFEKVNLNEIADEDTRMFYDLWLYDLLVEVKDRSRAKRIANRLKNRELTGEYLSVLRSYCNQLNIKLKDGESPIRCIDDRLRIKSLKNVNKIDTNIKNIEDGIVDIENSTGIPLIVPDNAINDSGKEVDGNNGVDLVDTKNQKKEQKKYVRSVDENVVINIIDANIENDHVKGMIYNMQTLGSKYTIKTVEKDYIITEDNEVLINIDNRTVLVNENYINFGVSFNKLLDMTAELSIFDTNAKVLITVSNDKQAEAKYMQELLLNMNIRSNIYVASNGSTDLQNYLQNYYRRNRYKSVINIIISDDDQMESILPIVRYTQTNNNLHKVVIVTSSLSSLSYNDDYRVYFKKIYIVTPNMYIKDDNIDILSDKYNAFFGEEMSYSSMVGYDMIEFLTSNINNLEANYLTNIENIENYNAVRYPKKYYINTNYKLREIR